MTFSHQKQKSLSFSEGSSLLRQWKLISSTRITKVSRGDWSSVVAVSVKVLLQIHKAPEKHVIKLFRAISGHFVSTVSTSAVTESPKAQQLHQLWMERRMERGKDRQTSTPAQWHPLLQPEQHMSCTHGHGG